MSETKNLTWFYNDMFYTLLFCKYPDVFRGFAPQLSIVIISRVEKLDCTRQKRLTTTARVPCCIIITHQH